MGVLDRLQGETSSHALHPGVLKKVQLTFCPGTIHSMAPKRTTRRLARVVADDISRPHEGATVKRVGPQTLASPRTSRARTVVRANSVKQIGPSSIRPANAPTGKVKRAGAANWEDTVVVEGVDRPYSRQAGSVKQVGPAERRLHQAHGRHGGVGEFRSGRLPRSSGLITTTPLLKSGAGRKHPWAVFAGQPGYRTSGNRAVRVSGGVGGNVLVNGRARKFGPEPLESTQVTPTGGNIVGGNVSDNTASAPVDRWLGCLCSRTDHRYGWLAT